MITGPQGWLKDEDDLSLSQTFVVRPGEQFYFTLASDLDKSPLASIFAALQSTLSYWRNWAGKCTYKGPYRDMVVRSALIMQLMTYAPSGAVVAAPTTSLPEEIGGERNWDYRFTWVRDGSLTLFALFLAGYHDFGESYARWIYNTVRPDDIKILYPITPEGQTTEEILDHLSGYRNSRPVRIGNGAVDQLQLDVVGEAMGAARFAWRMGIWKPPEEGRRLHKILDWLIERRHDPDSGIWEVRGGLRHFVYGKAMIWYALDAAIEIFEGLNLEGDTRRWREERDAIREEIMTRGWSAKLNAFKQSYEDEVLDAANLMLPIIGFIDGKDPRMLSTLDATMKDLVINGLCYRYIDAPEGLSGNEATFILCTFWLVSALILAGRVKEAREIFENLLAKASPLGLFAEEIDPVTGEQIGNFPQAFSHIGVIHAAVTFAYFAKIGKVDLEDWELGAKRYRGSSETIPDAGIQDESDHR